MNQSWFFRLLSLSFLSLFVLTPLACVVETHDSGTEIQFEETTNLGYRCGQALTSWNVIARETGEQGPADCEQPIRFVNLSAGATYTFDIVGFSGQTECWRGTCSVRAVHDTRIYANCSQQIQSLCGL